MAGLGTRTHFPKEKGGFFPESPGACHGGALATGSWTSLYPRRCGPGDPPETGGRLPSTHALGHCRLLSGGAPIRCLNPDSGCRLIKESRISKGKPVKPLSMRRPTRDEPRRQSLMHRRGRPSPSLPSGTLRVTLCLVLISVSIRTIVHCANKVGSAVPGGAAFSPEWR